MRMYTLSFSEGLHGRILYVKTAVLALLGRRGLKKSLILKLYHYFMFLRVFTTGDCIDYINIIIIRSLIMIN
jgi:hypothetical protein